MSWIILLVLCILGWCVIMLVTEFSVAQQGNDTWGWIKRLYHNTPWIQNIRW